MSLDSIQFNGSIQEISCKAKNITELSYLFNLIYPIGSIYCNENLIDPESIFGGKWERIKGKTLIGVDESDSSSTIKNSKQSGGSKTKKIEIKNLPSHNHTLSKSKITANSTTLKGNINNLASQTATTEVSCSGVFSVFSAGDGDGYGNFKEKHKASISINATHSHGVSGTSENTGNGEAIDIMPPYYSVYMWRRIS